MKQGEYTEYKDNQLIKQCQYLNNKLHGEYKEYENGNLIKFYNYKEGKLHGKFYEYENNILTRHCVYNNGVYVCEYIKAIYTNYELLKSMNNND